MSDKLRAAAQEARQCPSCGGGCKKSGCERANIEMNPQKREWVGLTGDEIEDINKDQTLWEIIRAAEEILREKNT